MRKEIHLTWTRETRNWGAGGTSTHTGTGNLDDRPVQVYAFPQGDLFSFWSQSWPAGGGSTSIPIRKNLPRGTVPVRLGPNGGIRETTTVEL